LRGSTNDGFARALPERIIQTNGPIGDHLLSLSIKPSGPHGSTAAVKGEIRGTSAYVQVFGRRQ